MLKQFSYNKNFGVAVHAKTGEDFHPVIIS